MDVPVNEDIKEAIITVQDFPYICRICLKRSNLSLFEEEHLLDLFQALTNVEVRSCVEYPRNICNECLNGLIDISLFIDISKYNNASFGKTMEPKKEILTFKDEIGDGMPPEHIEKSEKEMFIDGPETCRICLTPASSFTPFEEMIHLMQLFHHITNIDLKAESNSSVVKRVCNKCKNELVTISTFISLSICNDQKLQSVIAMSKKVENYSHPCDIELSAYQGLKFEGVGTENTCGENSPFHVRDETFEIVDIKEDISDVEEKIIDIKDEIYHSELPTTSSGNYFDKMDIHSQHLPEEKCFAVLFDDTLDNGNMPNQSKKKSSKCAHTKGNTLECDFCEKRFSWKSHLNQHMLTHTGEKPHKCDFCEKRFNRRSYLKEHMFTHTGEKPVKCDICEKRFSCKSHLNQHMLIHTGEKPHKCDFCKRWFHQRSGLIDHMSTHTGEKPHKCDFCEKRFSWKSYLNQHMVTHTGEKSHKCDLCEKRFKWKISLNQHILTHTGKKPHKCDICQKGFGREGDLTRHMLIHTRKSHSNVIAARKNVPVPTMIREYRCSLTPRKTYSNVRMRTKCSGVLPESIK